MKTKLLAMMAATVVAVTASLLWLMDAKIQKEREASAETGLRGPVNAIAQALQAELRGVRRALPTGSLDKSRIDWDDFRPFFALAQVQVSSEGPRIVQFAASDSGPLNDGNQATAESLMSSIKAWPGKGAAMMSVAKMDRRKVLLVALQDGDRTWVGFSGLEFLQGQLDLQKGSEGWIAVVNSKGQVLAHSTIEYVGTMLSGASLGDRIRRDGAVRGFRTVDDDSGANLTAFEKPARTDLTVVAARPLGPMLVERRKTLIFGAFVGLGLLLAAAATIWNSFGRWENDQARVREKMRSLSKETEKKNPPPPSASPALLKERQEAFMRIATALGYELRSPMMSILGSVQSILMAGKDPKISEAAEAIQRDTRVVRDVVDKLLAFAGENPGEKKPTRVETALAGALKGLDGRFIQKHVRVHKDLRETSEIPLDLDAVEKALRHVLANSVEAMERLPKKEIHVRLSETPAAVRLEIQDNGEGIDSANQARIFDPFFSTRDRIQHLGMGLPATLGFLREQGATLNVESTPGKGTTVIIEFPKSARTVEIDGAKVELKTEQTVAIPTGLPAPAATEELPQRPAGKAALAGTVSQTPFDALESEGASPRTSPTDVNIEDLLEMPVAAEPPPPEDRTVVLAATKTSANVEEPVPFEPAPVIDKPSFAPPSRSAKLDSFRPVIRRPGAGL